MTSFEDLHVSTRTVIVSTNLTFDIEKLFHSLPLNKDKILSVQYKDERRTVDRPLRQKIDKKRYFRNSITLVMVVNSDGKTINCKVSNKGNIQITGCSKYEYTESFVHYFWKLSPIYIKPSIYFLYVMNNVDFSLGFNIDLTKLHNYFAQLERSDFKSILEPAFGYVGLKISFPVFEGSDLPIPHLTYKNGDWIKTEVPYGRYLEEKNLTDVNPNKEGRFLVFRTGKVILTSGKDTGTMKTKYYEFYDLIQSIRNEIEERILSA